MSEQDITIHAILKRWTNSRFAFYLITTLLVACAQQSWKQDPDVQAARRDCDGLEQEKQYACIERHAVDSLNPDVCRLVGIWIDDMCLQAVYQAADDPTICDRLYLEGVRPACRDYYQQPAGDGERQADASSTSGATVTGRVVLGYGDHGPVSDLPLWVGQGSNGEPMTRTSADGSFQLMGLPTDLVDVVDSHLAFQVPISSPGEHVDLGLLKYPLIHPHTYYYWTPTPLPDLATLLNEGESVPFSICLTDPDWERPSEQAQRERVWSKRPFSEKTNEWLETWFARPAVIYNTVDMFVQSFPDGPNLDALASDWRYLLGLWNSTDIVAHSECAYDGQTLEDLLSRKQIEIWLLGYRASEVQRSGNHFAAHVSPASGYQIIRFAGVEDTIAVHLVCDGEKLLELPQWP